MYTVRFNNKEPSAQTFSVCSSKLKHYSILLTQKDNYDCSELANNFTKMANQLDDIIYANGNHRWIDLMKNEAGESIH